ncbi:MAG: hypothetical protein KF780_05105 [Sphingomonas sp.]|nr:hypothetical protein [Sphingomonas sp.]
MTSPLRHVLAIFPAAALGLALPALSPAFAASEAEGRAVAQCRAELARQFPEGALRSQRVGAISGNARQTRVTLYANADRRYTFDCVADGAGRIVTAELTPPNATRLAAESRTVAQTR